MATDLAFTLAISFPGILMYTSISEYSRVNLAVNVVSKFHQGGWQTLI